jgi:hypothetical protein
MMRAADRAPIRGTLAYLYVIARVDQREAPRCVSIVTLEMEPRDG